MKVVQPLIFTLILISALGLALPGCSVRRQGGSREVTLGAHPFVYRVQRQGETLGAISSWYTGSQGNWKTLASLNPGLDPTAMHVGDRIEIPQSMMQRRQPMPAGYSVAGRTRSRPGASDQEEAASQQDDSSLPSENASLLKSDPADHSLQGEVLRDRMEETLLQNQ